MSYPEPEELTTAGKVAGVICLLAFVVILFGAVWAAFTTNQPIIPYNPEVSQWELPWWMTN